jgi:hypothetical protein
MLETVCWKKALPIYIQACDAPEHTVAKCDTREEQLTFAVSESVPHGTVGAA